METEPLSFLRSADIFAVLEPAELAELADGLETQTLETGQAAVRQGEAGSSLFIVKSGRLSVYIADAGASVYVGDLWEGEFFGEMSLLTGTPRTATVQAANPAIIIEVTKTRLTPFMQLHPELASHMGRVLSERQSSNLKTLMDFERPSEDIEQEIVAEQISYKIRQFFDIPSSIWGKALEGISGLSINGPLGFILGKPSEPNTGPSPSGLADNDRQVAFTTAMITLVAKMAAAGGSYSQREISQLREIFDIPAGDMANVTRIYNRAQGSPKGFEPYAQQIAALFSDQPNVLEELIGALLKVAASANSGQPSMIGVVERIASLFGFTAQEFERLKTMNQNNTSSSGDHDRPYFLTVLALSDGATLQDAKKAYHRLAMQNHPDKLISEGMPEELIQHANQKLALINNAYEQFQAAHRSS